MKVTTPMVMATIWQTDLDVFAGLTGTAVSSNFFGSAAGLGSFSRLISFLTIKETQTDEISGARNTFNPHSQEIYKHTFRRALRVGLCWVRLC